MPIPTPPGMPPWWNRRIECGHCGVFIRAFTPKHPEAWERELQQLTERASERCYCRKPAEEIRALMAEPVQPFKEHTLYRAWLSQALQFRYKVIGEGRSLSDEWHRPESIPGLVQRYENQFKPRKTRKK